MDAQYVVILDDGKLHMDKLDYETACMIARGLAADHIGARIKSQRQYDLDNNSALKVDLSGLDGSVKAGLPVNKGAQAAAAVLSTFNTRPQARKGLIVEAIKVVLGAERSVFFRTLEDDTVVCKLNIVASALEWAQANGLVELPWLTFSEDKAGLTPARQRMLIQWTAFYKEMGRLPRKNEELAI